MNNASTPRVFRSKVFFTPLYEEIGVGACPSPTPGPAQAYAPRRPSAVSQRDVTARDQRKFKT